MLGSKLIIRQSVSEPLEFAAEFHYLYSRKQKITNPDGSSYYKLNGSGFADISLYCLYQWLRSSEQQKLGIMTMAELKLPTGTAINGVGTGSIDYNARIIGSYTTDAGPIFGMFIYIVNGNHTVSGFETRLGNEAFAAAGINSASWYGFGIDLALFYRVKTTNAIVENNGKPAYLDKINYRGVKSSLHKHFSKYIETGLVSEFGYFSNHTMWSGTKIIYKKPELCSMIGLKFTFQW
jgi:hypothetical protein